MSDFPLKHLTFLIDVVRAERGRGLLHLLLLRKLRSKKIAFLGPFQASWGPKSAIFELSTTRSICKKVYSTIGRGDQYRSSGCVKPHFVLLHNHLDQNPMEISMVF